MGWSIYAITHRLPSIMTDDSGTDGEWRSAALDIDTSVAHSARVYDYWLGGKDNFAADREVGEQVLAASPGLRQRVRANREFLVRAVCWLAGDAGIDQFLDIGTGIPSANNTHEVAQSVAPTSKIVYVDNDPIVLLHARSLLTSRSGGKTDYLPADLREPEKILTGAAKTLDLSQPVAVMLLGILHLIKDDEDPWAIVAGLMAAVPSGSYLALSHPGGDLIPNAAEGQRRYNERVSTPQKMRSRPEVARFFEGLELVEPGLVQAHQWRPDPDDEKPLGFVSAHCGVARKP
jgi:hypothetical protein